MVECPSCASKCIKRNGHIYSGKQNYRCLECGRQFVENPSKTSMNQQTKEAVLEAFQKKESIESIATNFALPKNALALLLEESNKDV